jgi:oxygen-independent coproporphyrinogen-3 oxidase
LTTSEFRKEEAVLSLMRLNRAFPEPEVVRILRAPENATLLEYIFQDPFGAHVFPGNVNDYPHDRFLQDMADSLESLKTIHLWTYIPLCRYKCNFCQFPVLILNANEKRAQEMARKWVDFNLAEAELWLTRLPALARAPIGEFNLLGGTPTELPIEELERLITFYKKNFNFNEQSSIRVEGSPDSLTYDKLACLRKLGCSAISFGIQSMDNDSLSAANRHHTDDDVYRVIEDSKRLGFQRISGDLIYGMVDQSVEGFLFDVRTLIELELSCVVATKLHLRSFDDTRTAISGISPAPWQFGHVREKLSQAGHDWPSLGEQYQMREGAVDLFTAADYSEHPTMYFSRRSAGPEKWKGLVVDQDKQHVELGIGLGASSACDWSEANITTDPNEYFAVIESGVLPLKEVRGFDAQARVTRSIGMALSACAPIYEEQHKRRFSSSSLFDNYWLPIFTDLSNRGLLTIDRACGKIELTRSGITLVEAIINTSLQRQPNGEGRSTFGPSEFKALV